MPPVALANLAFVQVVAATFPVQRCLRMAALIGRYKAAQAFEIEPVAKVYAVWAYDNAYIDRLERVP